MFVQSTSVSVLYRLSFILVLLLLTIQTSIAQTSNTLRAYSVESSIDTDGRLDEAAWQEADAVSGFLQFEPREGIPASHRTSVRVLYGPGHLYIGAELFDDDPEQIRSLLGRRDEINQADWFIVGIDSYFDQKTAYTFAVNAAGIQFDGLRAGDGGGGDGGGLRGVDASWDAIWSSAVSVTEEGWVVEMRIPYSMLRFSDNEVQTWGIHFTRVTSRLGEESEWPLVPRTQRENLVAHFGRLEGIHAIEPRRNLQIAPYTVARVQTFEHESRPGDLASDGSWDLGGDVKVGLGPNVTLDATINPDFGQVESDPAVLNLTAFETFYEERRPFFIEGTQIFNFSVGPGQMLYTRRIGAEAPIIAATKLSGRTTRGLSFGVLGARTDPDQNYGLTRLSQQIGRFSSAGGILTVFDAPALHNRRRSLAGGFDWDLRLANNRFGLEGFIAATHRTHPFTELDDETGFAGKLWARKRQGIWRYFVGLDLFNDQFNPNDIGQLDQNNFVAILTSAEHDLNGGRPFGPFLRADAEFFNFQSFSYREGLNLGMETNLESRWTLRGFQEIGLHFGVENLFGGYDLYETRGLGPRAQPFKLQFGIDFETDARRAWQIEPEFMFGFHDDGSRGFGAGIRGEWNVGSRISLSGDLETEWENNVVAWTSNETFWKTNGSWTIGTQSLPPTLLDPDDYVHFDDRGSLDAILSSVTAFDTNNRYFIPVFGARDTRSIDFTVRSSITFTPQLSLQFYGQLFVARGRYDQFQILQNRDHLVPFDPYPKRDDFSLNNLQANTVLRWEYRPGSVLYLVWTQGRHKRDQLNPLAPWGQSPYDTPVGDQITDTFTLFPENVFLVKLNYTFLR